MVTSSVSAFAGNPCDPARTPTSPRDPALESVIRSSKLLPPDPPPPHPHTSKIIPVATNPTNVYLATELPIMAALLLEAALAAGRRFPQISIYHRERAM
jgi:hypothetical protein